MALMRHHPRRSNFRPENVAESTKKAAAFLETITTNEPRWWEVGIEKCREMRELGQTPLPKPVYLPEGLNGTVPSRDAGYLPAFSWGGFVLATHKHSDTTLREHANKCQLTAISVGYRLAPERPYPAAVHDAIDATEYLVVHATEIHGLILPYGLFDLTLDLPTVSSSTKPLLINRAILERFNGAYIPGMSTTEHKHPCVSPLYEDLQTLVASAATLPESSSSSLLPPALFLCGTEDPLLDGTILMSSKWSIAGGETIVKIYPGATHGLRRSRVCLSRRRRMR
ncbi:Alpha/Beta hydrolase protein [Aspergillus granulosus]|uniref:Alpha/Beta hydrolase protein n=1 Tax=Aspergillus granulosus TaxID=176169 RepID=A0ABR4I4H0_9EURO